MTEKYVHVYFTVWNKFIINMIHLNHMVLHTGCAICPYCTNRNVSDTYSMSACRIQALYQSVLYNYKTQ